MSRQAQWLQWVPAVLEAPEHITTPVIDHATHEDRVMEVNFGGRSMDQRQANQRAYMWNRLKER